MRPHRVKVPIAGAVVAALLALGAVDAAAQNTGRITGTVVSAATQQPLAGAQLFVSGTNRGALTDARGRYLIPSVSPGQHEVQVQMIGYEPVSQTVTVQAGQAATADFEVEQHAIAMDEIVVTGVAGATQKTKLAFTVDRIDASQMPVAAVSVEQSVRGKVAGVQIVAGSGQPGSQADMLLRGATSINASGRGQDPLYIVDDVIVNGGLANLNPHDIESIEVIKGAAAASLYGSRAANGVVRITTTRGTTSEGARYTLFTEVGRSELPGEISVSKMHPFRMNSSGTSLVDEDGNDFDYFGDPDTEPVLESGDPNTSFQDNPYPGTTFDQLNRFYDPNPFLDTHLSVAGRRGNTNYYASVNYNQQDGVLYSNEGYQRQNYRLNVDHGFSEALQLSLSTFYATDQQDDAVGDFYNLTFMAPGADLLATDTATGRINANPDPHSNQGSPIYTMLYTDSWDRRARFMGSGQVRYAPTSWFDLEANISYDRTDFNEHIFQPKWYETFNGPTGGTVQKENSYEDALNAGATASFTRSWSSDLVTRSRVGYSYEAATEREFEAGGDDLVVEGVPSLNVTSTGQSVESSEQDVRFESYYAITDFDYKDRYIADVLVRRDGSSLFGDNQRWHTFFRGSFAWRMSQEDWWLAPDLLPEFKLRASRGTAGNWPRFSAQYETYNVSGGQVSPENLGNKELRPELVTETEVGLDFTMADRLTFTLTYANTVADDQILIVPLESFNGFATQWINAGTLESNTFEASVEAALFESEDVTWTMTALFDRSRSEITSMNVPAFQYGPGNAFYARVGEEYGTFYGFRWATSCDDLAAGVDCGNFQVNDDGYLVYVGDATFRDGMGVAEVVPDTLGTGEIVMDTTLYWQSASPDGGYAWGMPFYAQNEDGSNFLRLGNSIPDFNVGLSSAFRWRNLSLYALFDASVGFDVYNQTRQWAYRELRGGEVDQPASKEEELKKPVGYYSTLYDVNTINSHFVEDGTFVKLRDLSVAYAFEGDVLDGLGVGFAESATIRLNGRNLFTWTDYLGYDPEVGSGGSETGSAALGRFDSYQYPNFRTYSLAFEVVF